MQINITITTDGIMVERFANVTDTIPEMDFLFRHTRTGQGVEGDIESSINPDAIAQAYWSVASETEGAVLLLRMAREYRNLETADAA